MSYRTTFSTLISTLLLLASGLLAQQTSVTTGVLNTPGSTPAAATVTTPTTLPNIPIPAGIAVFAAFNQLGNPQWTAGFSAIYPVVGSIGVYGTTTADVYPKAAIDPTTKKHFYAIDSSVRQGVHKDLIDTGKWSFLLGGDVGPSLSQAQPSGIAVNLSSSFVATAVFKVNGTLSLIVPVRMLYISGIGWNPVAEAGVVINIKNLPKAKE